MRKIKEILRLHFYMGLSNRATGDTIDVVQGLRTRYYAIRRLLRDLELARADGSYPRLLGRLMRFDLLILDDWGLDPFTPVEARHLLEVVDERSPLRSTVITSQLPLENWHAAVPDPTLAWQTPSSMPGTQATKSS